MNLTYLPLLLMFAILNSCIELEISAPGFPSLMRDFSVSEAMIGLTISYNLVGFCIASLIYGPLSECYGRRKTMLVGNGILALGALGCVIAPSIEALLLARFVQGLGAATSAVVVSAIIADVYVADRAARLYGVMNAVFSTFMAIAPVAGGAINAALGWRGNYAVVAVISVLSWCCLFIFLKETKPVRATLNLTKILNDYKTLLLNPLFLSASTVPTLLYGSYLAFVAIAPFMYMKFYDLNMLQYTMYQGVIVVVFALSSMISGGVMNCLGTRGTIVASLVITIAGMTCMLFETTPLALTASMCLYSIGSALLTPIIFAYSIEIFPDIKGTASSAIMGLRYMLCAGLTGAASFLYDGRPVMLAGLLLCTTLVMAALTIGVMLKMKIQ